MKIRELRRKTEKELKDTIINLREKLRDLRFNLAGGKVKNIREIRHTKKDIARILTLLNASLRQKATAGQPQAETQKDGRKKNK